MKIFIDETLPKKQLRYLMHLVAVEHKINQLSFNSRATNLGGSYNITNNGIFINNKQRKKTMLCVFFHELAHHVAVQRKKWMSYHEGTNLDIAPSKQFDIENKIDIIAKSLWLKYVDTKKWGKYQFSYPKSKKGQLSAWLADYNSI
jgi:Zn-dependent peptidase ImmA (M78 family)